MGVRLIPNTPHVPAFAATPYATGEAVRCGPGCYIRDQRAALRLLAMPARFAESVCCAHGALAARRLLPPMYMGDASISSECVVFSVKGKQRSCAGRWLSRPAAVSGAPVARHSLRSCHPTAARVTPFGRVRGACGTSLPVVVSPTRSSGFRGINGRLPAVRVPSIYSTVRLTASLIALLYLSPDDELTGYGGKRDLVVLGYSKPITLDSESSGPVSRKAEQEVLNLNFIFELETS